MAMQFYNPKLKSSGALEVTGDFDTHGDVVGDVVIRFLIIGDGQEASPILGEANLPQADLTRTTYPDGGVITKGNFGAIVPNSGLTGGEVVRGIGLAVTVKRSDNPADPPAFETFTWCVKLVVATGED